MVMGIEGLANGIDHGNAVPFEGAAIIAFGENDAVGAALATVTV